MAFIAVFAVPQWFGSHDWIHRFPRQEHHIPGLPHAQHVGAFFESLESRVLLHSSAERMFVVRASPASRCARFDLSFFFFYFVWRQPPDRVKGIYMKFRGDGLIEDVVYENIVMDSPEQYAIWIG